MKLSELYEIGQIISFYHPEKLILMTGQVSMFSINSSIDGRDRMIVAPVKGDQKWCGNVVFVQGPPLYGCEIESFYIYNDI